MAFDKKVIVLKQVENGFSAGGRAAAGIVRIETEDGVCSLFLSPVNFAAKGSGEYILFVMDGKREIYRFSLGVRPCSLSAAFDFPPDLSKGFAAGICFLSADIPVLVAYQRTENFPRTVQDFKKAVAEHCIERRKNRRAEETPPVYNMRDKSGTDTAADKIASGAAEKRGDCGGNGKERTENGGVNAEKGGFEKVCDSADAESAAEVLKNTDDGKNEYDENVKKESAACGDGTTVYDDEAVATENFYELDESITEKVNLLEAAEVAENENIRNKNIGSDCGEQKAAEKDGDDIKMFADETDSVRREEYSRQNPFYLTVKEELDSLFDKFPAEEGLCAIFPDGKFARINYSAEKYYVVGLIRERGEEKYVCYGVPSVYSETPPKELDGYCSFIPLSVFDMKGDGFWMMFQDAVTGECIKPGKGR